MAICHYCKQDIDEATGCDAPLLCDRKGQCYPRIAFGGEKRKEGLRRQSTRCPDCHVVAGMLHHPGCVREECPACHKLIAACRCSLNVQPRSSEGAASDPEESTAVPRTELPTYRPTIEQQRDLLTALRIGKQAGCWDRADCQLTIAGGSVQHECAGQEDEFSLNGEEETVKRLREAHSRAAG